MGDALGCALGARQPLLPREGAAAGEAVVRCAALGGVRGGCHRRDGGEADARRQLAGPHARVLPLARRPLRADPLHRRAPTHEEAGDRIRARQHRAQPLLQHPQGGCRGARRVGGDEGRGHRPQGPRGRGRRVGRRAGLAGGDLARRKLIRGVPHGRAGRLVPPLRPELRRGGQAPHLGRGRPAGEDATPGDRRGRVVFLGGGLRPPRRHPRRRHGLLRAAGHPRRGRRADREAQRHGLGGRVLPMVRRRVDAVADGARCFARRLVHPQRAAGLPHRHGGRHGGAARGEGPQRHVPRRRPALGRRPRRAQPPPAHRLVEDLLPGGRAAPGARERHREAALAGCAERDVA
mmetsp:Transcript_63730/g.178339  ORF Transcript_63730/g.178339 Transcript_63730/m.178339 type:complete len:349 (+) Transcript_63730:379-1425(+)